MNTIRFTSVGLRASFFVALFFSTTQLLNHSTLFAQGGITPTGPPGPTMKALDQIEPRTAIESLPFNITQSGSYYFTKNLNFTAASGDAITISASNVTLDLMGFTLSSSNAVTGDAIRMNAGLRNIAVRNGVIAGNTTVTISGSAPNQTWTVAAAGFNNGINALASPEASSCHFSQLRISGCRSVGLDGGGQAVVEQVTATQNGNIGIVAMSGSVTNSTASSNGDAGIVAMSGSVTGCTASNNGGAGIFATSGSVTGCTASNNASTGIFGSSVANSRSANNGSDGIAASSGSVTNCTAGANGSSGIVGENITHCVAVFNTSHGIFVSGTAKDNECRNNGNGGSGAGIYFASDGVRIEGNNCYNNDWGIQSAAGVSSFIVRNSCRGNTAPATNAAPATPNYDFDRASNTYGPVLTVNGDMSANAATSHPGANIQY